MGDHQAQLSRDLRASPQALAVIERLTDAEAAELLTMFHQARERQSQELETAQQQALDRLPGMLRGPVRKILLG